MVEGVKTLFNEWGDANLLQSKTGVIAVIVVCSI
jgi:hypothetical protein